MPQLDPTWFASQLFWLIASTALLYVMLSRVVLPPLMKVLEDRQHTREHDLSKAQQLKNDAEAARADYERALADARVRSQKIFAEAEMKAKEQSEKALAELSRTLNAQITDAERRISAQKDELAKSLESTAVELAAAAVEKLLRGKPDTARLQVLVQQLTKA